MLVEIPKVDTDSELPILISDGDNICEPIWMMFFFDEAKVDEFLNFILDSLHYLGAKPSLLLIDRFHF